MALLKAASRRGIWLPLVLDEPFERLDAGSTAALAAVLENFCRDGHQVVVLTAQRAAAEQLASHGAMVHDVLSLRGKRPTISSTPSPTPPTRETVVETRRAITKRRKATQPHKVRPARPSNGEPLNEARGKSDAA
jgi:energy-coupling factor transporter ATP-binding protein EcfA2